MLRDGRFKTQLYLVFDFNYLLMKLFALYISYGNCRVLQQGQLNAAGTGIKLQTMLLLACMPRNITHFKAMLNLIQFA